MVLYFLNVNFGFCQHSIYGQITDKNTNEIIPFANILIKDYQTKNLISFTTTNDNGLYSIEFPELLSKIIIETSILSHKVSSKSLEKSKLKIYRYEVNFKLTTSLSELEEVLIETKKPILVKNDTTVYRPNSFKDGTEKVLEDLLKKLPGISIAENGSIKFKGKQVTRVLLDNDNLFDDNYTIGTKNINPDIVEEIQAIEDYQKNPLLKGLKNSNDVALNLTLKKGKTDVSGNFDLGLGIEDKYHLKSNILSISKKIKGFGLANYNNVNKNYSPYNFISNDFDLSKANESLLRTNNLLDTNTFNSLIPEEHIGFNKKFFGSLNALNKFSKNTSLRVNTNYLSDKLVINNFSETNYNFNENNILVNNTNDLIKKPNVNVIDYELITRPKENALLNFKGKVDYTTLKINSLSTNNTASFVENKKSEDLFVNQKIEYTNKINKKSAFQIVGNMSRNNIPQYLNFKSININNTIDQDVKFTKSSFDISSKFLSKFNKGNYSLSLGFKNKKHILSSDNNIVDFDDFLNTNSTELKENTLYLGFNYLLKLNKWKFIFENQLNSSNVEIINNLVISKNKQYINNPSITTYYSLDRHSNIYFNYNIKNSIPQFEKIYSGIIQTGNRNLLSNEFEFNRIKNKNLSLGYRINDFYNLFQFNSYFNYSKRNYGYLNKIFIDEDTTLNISDLEKLNNSNYRFGVDTEKYINYIRSTLNLKSSYTINNYKNNINNNEIRDNKNKSLYLQLEIRTGFQNNLNFVNKIIYQSNTFSSDKSNTTNFSTFQNNLSTKYVKNRFNFTIDTKYFDSNLKVKNNSLTFVDAIFNYEQKNEKIEYEFRFNNLLNKKLYQEINSSDFSTTINTQRLLERYFMFSIRFKL